MRECGEVVAIKGDIAYVRMTRGEACGGCNLCSVFGENSPVLEAHNTAGVRTGDRVLVEIPPETIVGHSLLIFIMPILFLLVGYFIGNYIAWPGGMSGEARGILAGLLFFLLSFLLIKVCDLRYTRTGRRPATIIGLSEKS